MPRLPVLPDFTRTLHAIGDQHHGNISTTRKGVYETGLAARMTHRDDVVGHLFLGDLTNTAIPAQDALYAAHLTNYGTAPTYAVLGNHDVYNDVRTPEAAALTLGLPSRNWTADLGFALLVGVFPGDGFAAYNSGSQFAPGALAWLEGVLASATKDVWIACHFPIYDTVAGLDSDPAVFKRSVTSGYYVAVSGGNTLNSDQVLQLLEAYPNVKAWISGHTHSSLSAPDLFTTVQIGARQIIHINVGSVAPTDVAASAFSQLNTMLLTHTDDGVDVRIRAHHGGGSFNTYGGQRVISLVAS